MRIVVGLAALLVLAAGCGGGGSDGHETFIEKADAICTDFQRQVGQIPPVQDPSSMIQIAAFLQRFAPLVRSETAELRRLELPEQDRADMARYIAALAAQAAFVDRARATARRRNQVGMEIAVRQWQTWTEEETRLAHELGFTVCGGGVR